jgi:hypothetical protein
MKFEDPAELRAIKGVSRGCPKKYFSGGLWVQP